MKGSGIIDQRNSKGLEANSGNWGGTAKGSVLSFRPQAFVPGTFCLIPAQVEQRLWPLAMCPRP